MAETPTATGGIVKREGCRGSEGFHFLAHVVRGRWFTVFASFLIMSGAGSAYLFGTYSKDIKASLGYDQTTLNLLGFFKDLGNNFGVPSGLLAEVTPKWFVLLVGSAMNFAGYFMIWLSVTGRMAKPKLWQMCLYISMGANSSNFANTGVVVTCVKNFPESRGALIGLLKGCTGLSGAVLTQFYLAIYGNDSKSLILLIAWLPAALSVVFVYTIRTMKAVRHPNELRVFYHFLYVSIVLALFLMAMNIVQRMVVFSEAAYAGSATVVCFLLFIPLFIVIREELVLWNLKKQPVNPPSEITIENTISEANAAKEEALRPAASVKAEGKEEVSCCLNICDKPERGEDYTILQALLSIDMLILLLSSLFGLGSSLTAVDNLGQIGESLGYPAKTINSFISLVSIWNYFGRVFAGYVSEILLVKYKVPRPLMLTLVLLLSCVGLLLIAFPIPGSVYIASIIIGFSFGAQLPLRYAIVSELFGLKYFATLFNIGQMTSPLGSYILNVTVTGRLYDREALKELAAKGMSRSSVKELTCIGTQCYRLSFIIMAAFTFTGAVLQFILVTRTRKFYKSDIYKKFRENAESSQSQTERELASVKEQQ